MKSNFTKRLLWSLGILLGSIGIVIAALFILSNSLNAKAAAIIQNRSAEQAANASLSQLAELEHDQPIAAKYIAAVGQIIPKQKTLISFPGLVASIGVTDSVTATVSFTGNPATPVPGTLGNAVFTVNSQGSFTNLVIFLNDLETKTPGFLLNIGSFSITNSGPNAELTASGNLFFQ